MLIVLKLVMYAALGLALACGVMAGLTYYGLWFPPEDAAGQTDMAYIFAHLMAMLTGSALLVAFASRFALKKLSQDQGDA